MEATDSSSLLKLATFDCSSVNIVGIGETAGENALTSSEKGLFRKGFTMSGCH